MAPKRASPLDDPPAASSEEEQEGSTEEGEEEEEQATSEEKEEEEEEEEEENESANPSSSLPPTTVEKKHPSKSTANSQPQSQSPYSESGSESDSGSDSEDTHVDPKVRPIASKTMEETPKVKKPRSLPSAASPRSAKRTSESNHQGNDSKRHKKKGNDDGLDSVEDDLKKSGGDDPKKLFQRIWCEDDEITILKGMVEYSEKKGADPYKDMTAFHDFIKKSLLVDVSKVQLMDKIRRLRKKFENNVGKGKNGEDPYISKPHERKAFELSKKIWGNEGVEQVKSNGKARVNQKGAAARSLAILKAELPHSSLDSKEPEKRDAGKNSGPVLSLSEMIRFDKNLGQSGMDETVVKRGLELMGAEKRAELEERWRSLHSAEFELYRKRAELISDQAGLIWEAYKQSIH